MSAHSEEILHQPCADTNRCTWAADLKHRIWHSLYRVGWWETSERLFAYWSLP